jgi:hypothetical protein
MNRAHQGWYPPYRSTGRSLPEHHHPIDTRILPEKPPEPARVWLAVVPMRLSLALHLCLDHLGNLLTSEKPCLACFSLDIFGKLQLHIQIYNQHGMVLSLTYYMLIMTQLRLFQKNVKPTTNCRFSPLDANNCAPLPRNSV